MAGANVNAAVEGPGTPAIADALYKGKRGAETEDIVQTLLGGCNCTHNGAVVCCIHAVVCKSSQPRMQAATQRNSCTLDNADRLMGSLNGLLQPSSNTHVMNSRAVRWLGLRV